MIKTLINLLNTFHRNDKEIIKQIIKLLMEFYKKTNDKYILKLVIKSEIYNKFSKEDKSIINLIMCENLINFKEVLNENLNSLEFLKIYLKEIEIFIKKIIFNNKYELEDLLSFYEHIVFIINISNSYSFQIRKQIFNLLSMTTKYFLDNNKPFKELEDKQLENSLLVYERYKIYSTNITSYLKKIEKCISVIMNEDNHRKLLIDKTIPKFLINMRELEDYLNTFIFLKGINEDFRINKRGFILEK